MTEKLDKNLELLNNDVFFLPKERNNPDFPSFLEKILSEYLSKLDKFDGVVGKNIKESKGKIEALCESLLKSIQFYYNGNPSKAYEMFSQGMASVADILWKQKRDFSSGTQDLHFYRARSSDGSRQYDKKEMTHIPFQDRHKIASNRYSIPGYPCLYLANSTYTCWIECGKPNFETMQVCRFDGSKYRFLELSLTPRFFTKFYESSREEKELQEIADSYITYILTAWPLIAACSIRKMKYPVGERTNFVAEYVFPQMLMEWVRLSEDLDGVKYFSTHNDNTFEVEFGEMINYAIPVKKICDSGYCPQLAYDLPLSEPIFYNLVLNKIPDLEKIKYSTGNGDPAKAGYYRTFPSLMFLHESGKKREWYIDTKFGKLEVALNKLKTERMQIAE
jgi:hypothetical protein